MLLSLGSVGLPVPESLEQFQSDGVDGSGSGSGPGDIETDDDSVRGSGSGGGPPPGKEVPLIGLFCFFFFILNYQEVQIC